MEKFWECHRILKSVPRLSVRNNTEENMNKLLILFAILISSNAFAWTFTATKIDKSGKKMDEYSYKITAEYSGTISPFPDLACIFGPSQKVGTEFGKSVTCSLNGALNVGTIAFSGQPYGSTFFYSLDSEANSAAKYEVWLRH
jgi:hypothetical protein